MIYQLKNFHRRYTPPFSNSSINDNTKRCIQDVFLFGQAIFKESNAKVYWLTGRKQGIPRWRCHLFILIACDSFIQFSPCYLYRSFLLRFYITIVCFFSFTIIIASKVRLKRNWSSIRQSWREHESIKLHYSFVTLTILKVDKREKKQK